MAALSLEAIVVAFMIATIYGLHEASGVKVAAIVVVVGLVLVAAGIQRRPQGLVAGSVVQVLVIATGVITPVMFFLGVIFAGLWCGYLAMHRSLGRQLGSSP